MPIYLVVSETLYERIPILDYGEGPDEPYRIVELVSARSREQARYLAWETDNNFSSDVRDMPNFRTMKLTDKGLDVHSVCSDHPYWSRLFNHPKAIEFLHSVDGD